MNGHKHVHAPKWPQCTKLIVGRVTLMVIFCTYMVDSAYPLRPQLMGPFGGNNLAQDRQLW